jgi:hypothetical protein
LTVLALKLLLAPGFVVATSLVSRRFGVGVAGVVGGLPAIAGPILLVLALDHGRGFAQDAATGALLGMVALVVFVLAYVVVSRRATWPWAVAVGWGCFLIVVAALRPVHVGPVFAFIAAGGACACGLVLLPRTGSVPSSRPQPPHDLSLRGACAVLPVISVTAAASLLGPHLSGLIATFPVITPVLAAFTQAQQGHIETARLLRGMTVGFFAYALFCFTVSAGIVRLGTTVAFALATALALAAQATAVGLARRRAAG